MSSTALATEDDLRSLIRDAARLSAAHGALAEAWAAERAVHRAPGDAAWTRRGWLGFCVLSAHVTGRVDPASPPGDDEMAPLREVFADPAVRDVVLTYYFTPGAGRAHESAGDADLLEAVSAGYATEGLLRGFGPDAGWEWSLHRVGTSALVLAATPQDPRLRTVAVKAIVPPYLEWADIRRSVQESGRNNVESDALARTHAATEAVLITSFIAGPTLAEAFATRDRALRAAAGSRPRPFAPSSRRDADQDAAGTRFAIDHWLPVARALARLDRDLPGVGHGDLSPSNVILAEGRAVLVDLGPSHLLRTNPGTGPQTVRKLSRYTAPEMLDAGGPVDRRGADLYSLGDLLLDALVIEGADDNERIARVYRYSFELGQLVDTLRSYDPALRTAVHRPAGAPFDLTTFVAMAERILDAADALRGTGLRGYRLSGILLRRRGFPGDPATRPADVAERAATLGSRERWTIRWFQASSAIAQLLGCTVAVGLLVMAVVGCDSPLAPDVCTARDVLGGESGLLGLGGDALRRGGVVAIAVTWLFVVHCFYTRIFAQLRPALCRRLAYRRSSEALIRFVAVPGHLVVAGGILVPDLWWAFSGAGALLAAVNNSVFTRFLRSGVDLLRRHARGPAARDSLAAAADAVEEFVDREYGKWAVLMSVYGVGFLAMGWWLARTRSGLRADGLGGAELDAAVGYVEWTLIVIVAIVNLTMLYRNCSEMGRKAPEVRANGARVIAACLRLDAAEAATRAPAATAPAAAAAANATATGRAATGSAVTAPGGGGAAAPAASAGAR